MKESIGKLIFPFAKKKPTPDVTDRIADDIDPTQFLELNFEEIVEPEENWMGSNRDGISQSITTLEKSRPCGKRSKFSILNAQNIMVCQPVPILANGFTGTGFETSNTCAFDCIFSTYACLYSDYTKFTTAIDERQSSSELCAFIRKTSMQKKIVRKTYIDRNKMLYNLAGESGKLKKLTSLDCETGVGDLFANICKKNDFFATSLLNRTCHECEFAARLVRPFLPIAAREIDLCNLQMYIADPSMQEEFCPQCKHVCIAEHHFNPVLALEVEPISSDVQKQFKVEDLTPQIRVNETIWNLCGVIENKGRHFICHMLRSSNVWETYDDLSAKMTHLEKSEPLAIFMMFYLSSGN